ncbi:MAG: DEAD/DEAH box helicase [Gammaproteobacteria bacterium]|nr:DEAD/DEAH box helicase [Gammaproteobacteria bacterium]
MSFDTLGLSAELLRAVADQGYSEPTPVQSRAIPVILQGKDLLAGAQTGTGKTAGFTLPLLQRLNATAPDKGRRRVRALILTPTRELAAQVAESVDTYGKHLPLSSMVIFGGVKINPQIARLRAGVDILVATPGRLLDHVSQKTLDLSAVEILVLDEADRMLDMGFIRDIRKILALLPKRRQNLLFSATYSNDIRQLADKLLDRPVLIDVALRNTPAERVSQVIHPVDRERKRELLSFMVGSQNWRQVLVFTRTKHGANRLSQQLEKDGISSAAIHGNKSQGARTRALADFKRGEVRVLVATDIAARGLDIDQLPHVVNYELPNVPEDYVHRIGRTGRAGNEGQAVSLVCIDEHKLLGDIERLLKRDLSRIVIPGYEPDPSIRAEPIKPRSNTRPRGQAKSLHNNRPARVKAKENKRRPGPEKAKGNSRRPLQSSRHA